MQPEQDIKSDRVCQVVDLGLVDYDRAWQIQKQLVQRHKDQPQSDWLLLAEHPPVYTLGQGSTLDHVKFNLDQPPHPVYRIERGGEVTYHCPGQIVGYPILDLKRHCQDLHWYLRQLEAVLIQTLEYFSVPAERQPNLTGVWVGDYKLAAIGIKVSRWITMHGFALNVCPDLAGFQQIVPCGIGHRPVGSLDQFCPGITIATVRPVLLEAFSQVFDLSLHSDACLPSGNGLIELPPRL